MPKKLTLEEFIEKAKKLHGDYYDYSKVNYINNSTKITIICPIHGEFNQQPSRHIFKKGEGCPKCSVQRRTSTTEQFIEKSREIHGDKYDYSESDYKGADKKVNIICPIHGIFAQAASSHTRGHGCKKCIIPQESHWGRTNWVKKANDRNCIFYIIKCFNDNEEFYKVGITLQKIQKRYSSLIKMPYNYEIISEIYGEAGSIWDLECGLKIKLKSLHYTPDIYFGGAKTECFTDYKI